LLAGKCKPFPFVQFTDMEILYVDLFTELDTLDLTKVDNLFLFLSSHTEILSNQKQVSVDNLKS